VLENGLGNKNKHLEVRLRVNRTNLRVVVEQAKSRRAALMQVIIEFSDGVLSKRCALYGLWICAWERLTARLFILQQKSQRYPFSERQGRAWIPTVRACLVPPKSKKWRNKACKCGDVLRADHGASAPQIGGIADLRQGQGAGNPSLETPQS